ncbi:MAG: thioredoxin family protein [Minicystis sp.]
MRALPTVIVFANGKEVARHVGLTRKETLLKMLGAPRAQGNAPSTA